MDSDWILGLECWLDSGYILGGTWKHHDHPVVKVI